MKYRNTIQSSCDIDFFMLVNGLPVHAVSFGMPLPEAVNDMKKNRELILLISELKEATEVSLNENYIRNRLEMLYTPINQIEGFNWDEAITNYKKTFEIMASKGFYSFDMDIIPYMNKEGYYNPITEYNVSYQLIAKPQIRLELPKEIINKLPIIEVENFDIEKPIFLTDLNKGWRKRH